MWAIWSPLLLFLPPLCCQKPWHLASFAMFLKPSLRSAHFQQREHRLERLWHPALLAHTETLRRAGSVLCGSRLLLDGCRALALKGLRENLKSLKHIPDAGVSNMVNNERPGFFLPVTQHTFSSPRKCCHSSSRLPAAAPELSSHWFLPSTDRTLYLLIYDWRFLEQWSKPKQNSEPIKRPIFSFIHIHLAKLEPGKCEIHPMYHRHGMFKTGQPQPQYWTL